MTKYGKPMYHNGEMDGYDDIVKFCDDCGEEHKTEYRPDYDCDLCPKCEGERINQDIKDGVIAE